MQRISRTIRRPKLLRRSSTRNEYKEDIYVGYRYFETFAKEKVLYPFGFGLSYTTFAVTAEAKEKDVDNVTVTATVENTGKTDGKEVVQVYVKAPQGVLGKPSRALVGFAKTGVLAPGAKETADDRCDQRELCILR